MQRVVAGRSFTLSKTFYSDGIAVTPTGTPTVAIVRADGTTVTAGSVGGSGTGPYTVTVTAANNLLLDRLTVTWTATIGGQANTYVDTVEVAGDLLFTISQARTAIGDPAYDAGKIADARTYAETELENALGFALVPRYCRETVSGSLPGRYSNTSRSDLGLRLSKPYIRTIRSVSVNGTAVTGSDLTAVVADGPFLYGNSWATGYNNVTVGYEHGRDYPLPGAQKAALDEALAYLGDSAGGGSVDARAESIVTADGTIRLRALGAANLLSATASNWVASNRLVSVA